MSPLVLLSGFIFKHFFCDFPLQSTPWMYRNKGTYGHLGGIVHALIHVLGTILVLTLAGLKTAILWGLLDGLIHYHIDWAKMRLGEAWDLRPTNSEWFWILLGVDQMLHYLTYIGIVWAVT